MRDETPKCHDCGRFFRLQPGCAWQMVYSGGPIPDPDREIFRCLPCVERLGTFTPQHGIRPEYSCGVWRDETGAARRG
jgi:hypothetical protein